ncbi:MAG: protease modulator HflC [Pseudomonadota bacterium]
MVRRLGSDVQQRENTASTGAVSANAILRYGVGSLCIAALLLFSICFSIREGRQGVILRFGEPVRVVDRAGLHFKAPWPIERVMEIDSRKRSISTPQTELLTRDKKNIVLMTGGAWRPSDPVLFYRALGSIESADEKLVGLVINAKIAVFGRYDLSALVSTDTATLQVERVEQDVLADVNRIATNKYGVEVTHVGFQRVSLPERNVIFVLEQMRSERRQVAARFRAEGELKAARIRSEADLAAAKLIAEAKETAARTIGRADAEAARTYAAAHAQDPQFYRFVRSLDTLREALGSTSVVTLRTDAEPFHLLVDNVSLDTDESKSPPAQAAADSDTALAANQSSDQAGEDR